MANVICHICLRTDIYAVILAEELRDFFDELCDYNIISNPRYKFCTICAHLLKKFYNFKQRCLKACKILKSLKGKQKILPTNLHEQIPSSIGLCSSLAPYKVFEHQHQTDTDLLETKPDLNNEPSITLNNAEVTLEITDPIQPDNIAVKDEPVDDLLDSVVLDTDTKKDGSQDNAKQSKINDFFKSFGEEINEFEDKVDADDTEVKDNKFMLNNDPLKDDGNENPIDDPRDDESLNSMDDIESDNSDSDYDVESQPVDEDNFESDSDLDRLTDMVEKAKKIKINEINDLELAQLLLKIDKKNKQLKKRVQFLKDKGKARDCLLQLFENDEYNLSNGVKISKEVFLKTYERCPSYINSFNIKDTKNKKKTDEFLCYLYKMYNPEYETVFDIEYLDTEEKKLQEFNRRKDREEYKNAPHQCTRCFKGFQMERLHAYHMKKHDESSGAHECSICYLRFETSSNLRSHTSKCHSVVYVCRECHSTFYYFSTMINHFNLHKGKEFQCPICNGIYRTATGLANHKRSHVTSHICTTCARSFVSQKGLWFHRKTKHRDAPKPTTEVQCDQCPLTLDSQFAYERHLKVSHRTNRFVCNCLKCFETLADLREHKVEAGHQHCRRVAPGTISGLMKKGSGRSKRAPVGNVALRTCPICQEKVPNDSLKALYNHHQRKHPDEPYRGEEKTSDKNYLCELCGKQLYGYSFYIYHMNSHNGVRPYKCSECPRTFTHNSSLWSHKGWHRPAKYKCKVCGKLFKTPSNLCSHMRIHKNDRRYVCSICSATFIHASSLTVHIKGVHQNQKRTRKNKKLDTCT